MIVLTRSQRDTIARAWRALEYATQRTDWGMPHRLRDALKYEKRARSETIVAKALLVECAADGARHPSYPADDLYNRSRGCAEAVLIGAALQSRFPDALPPDFLDLADAARDAHRAGLTAALDKINSEVMEHEQLMAAIKAADCYTERDGGDWYVVAAGGARLAEGFEQRRTAQIAIVYLNTGVLPKGWKVLSRNDLFNEIDCGQGYPATVWNREVARRAEERRFPPQLNQEGRDNVNT